MFIISHDSDYSNNDGFIIHITKIIIIGNNSIINMPIILVTITIIFWYFILNILQQLRVKLINILTF